MALRRYFAAALVAAAFAFCLGFGTSYAYGADDQGTLMAGSVESLAADDQTVSVRKTTESASSETDAVKTATVYGLYHPRSGKYYYTISLKKRDNLKKSGWKSQGAVCTVPEKSKIPVYRLYNAKLRQHHFTQDKAERKRLVGSGWKNQGVAWYAADSTQARVAVYCDQMPGGKKGQCRYSFTGTDHRKLIKKGWTSKGVAWYALPTKAQLSNGWILKGSKWYYMKKGVPLTSQWLDTNNNPAIANAKGKQRYWLDSKGVLARNRLVDPKSDRDKGAKYYSYALKGGNILRNGKWNNGKGQMYLADKEGRLPVTKGWLWTSKYDGSKQRYYIEPKTHAARVGVFKVGKDWYMGRGDQGYVLRGKWYNGTNLMYVADNQGRLPRTKGWLWTKKYDGTKQRYYIDGKTHAARVGIFKVGKEKYMGRGDHGYVLRGKWYDGKGRTYLADSKGRLVKGSGWIVTSKYGNGKQRYYIDGKRNAAYSGFFRVGGKLYWGVPGQGHVVRSKLFEAKGAWYYADGKGALRKDAQITRLYRKAQGYASDTRYLIMIDIDNPRFILLEGRQWHWNIKNVWECDTGHPSTPTIRGVYKMGIKGYSFGHGYTCYYYSQILGDYLIHTRIYREGTWILNDGPLGRRCSQGCVRLATPNAKWVWDHVPSGTTIVTTT